MIQKNNEQNRFHPSFRLQDFRVFSLRQQIVGGIDWLEVLHTGQLAVSDARNIPTYHSSSRKYEWLLAYNTQLWSTHTHTLYDVYLVFLLPCTRFYAASPSCYTRILPCLPRKNGLSMSTRNPSMNLGKWFCDVTSQMFFFRRVSSSQRGTQKLGNWGGCTSMFLSFRGCQWHITPLIRLKTMFAHYTPFLVERHSSEPSVRNFVKGLNWPQKPIKLFVFLNFQASNVMLRHTH